VSEIDDFIADTTNKIIVNIQSIHSSSLFFIKIQFFFFFQNLILILIYDINFDYF
jgi:hypothetical protein